MSSLPKRQGKYPQGPASPGAWDREGEEGAGGPRKILPYQAPGPSRHREPPLSLAPSLQADDSTCGRILMTTATSVNLANPNVTHM